MTATIVGIVAHSKSDPTRVCVSVALDIESACKLQAAGFPSIYRCWGKADVLKVGATFNAIGVERAVPQSTDDKDSSKVYPAYTSLVLA